MAKWLDVVGIGEDGILSLSAAAQSVLEEAEVIIGGERHHALAAHYNAERVAWTKPLSEIILTVKAHRPRPTVLLVTGDPLWYSAGAKLLGAIPLDEIRFHPQLSAFQLACARMGWSLPDIETLTVHGRFMEQLVPSLRPKARLVVLTGGASAVKEAAKLLLRHGYSQSIMTVLAEMGGPNEKRFTHCAADWASNDHPIPSFHTLCIDCISDASADILSRQPGLPDSVFESDGNFTKQDIRAITVCMLAPHFGEVLWDIGTGSGTVAIEWMRAARDGHAIGIDRNSKRIEMAKKNAFQLGVPRFQLIHGQAPEALQGLPLPHAIFIGGGLSSELVELTFERLRPYGRIVANAVTVESENILSSLHAKFGGDLARLTTSRAKSLPSGGRVWHQPMTVTQWRLKK